MLNEQDGDAIVKLFDELDELTRKPYQAAKKEIDERSANKMSTMLHELGHSVYSSKNIPKSMPYLLRMESHILTTEGVAMQFQKFSKSRAWLEKMGVPVENPKAFDDAAAKMLRNELLIFSRW